ncbi:MULTISPECIES: tRNA (uridine(54)-C5)-methyltransferase TrmA [unclassified Oleiphilus]|uniref:tRNA (uridine(54)-C5)-methyltransferase TrmA n=1 Tax=unclassified Oleiphilus TaxID=2631174 RepID=UPI0007C23D79|nr:MULTISPECIES: tRNA (uridine(54)-C5)-methyltransferase TrmA [unclassified Oleiphilus]KZY43375.1 tRNA (uridine(54)-C5)-methyltransferase TrmA [Oleiphilus sp. HI0050]KZY30383.1 tRNA (uridine(54)-C5)-methyltransferase TrmA [Oleiphilus sp. HI0043]KZY58460.1 tRNA (uridine(54)-C5)-methyltransferase TrmA [Oleiphilus sp. HI0061]KZZ34461.1 tRNA (uridine(54)-C5)-methyltransferase TrmA [Oleiphilus sp. HI0086]KZZ62522.1 tRNA (uridine(54)-C5)-methyltransferase TrmA [Oleiphilus sp. HI0128]
MQDFQIDQYDSLLDNKAAQVREQFLRFSAPELEVFASEVENFRLRAEFKIWHEGERCFHAMFEKGTKNAPIEITHFPIASKAITELMPVMMEEINQSPQLKHRLFQLEYLSTLSGEMLVTLIYHKQLDEIWIKEAKRLKEKLGIHIIGRARKLKLLLDQDYVIEILNVDGKALRYKQIEGGFTQPNGKMNEKMLSWARSCVDGNKGDLLELYCGNGNFSIAMADKFRRVFATEISKTSVKAANDNKEMNRIDNVDFARVSAEEFTGHMNGIQKRRRLKDLNLEETDFQTVLVDPPRSGLDDESCEMISQYPNIVYISCNPDTLELNLEQLSKTHEIKRLAMFDQFPYTHHIECGVYLSKK